MTDKNEISLVSSSKSQQKQMHLCYDLNLTLMLRNTYDWCRLKGKSLSKWTLVLDSRCGSSPQTEDHCGTEFLPEETWWMEELRSLSNSRHAHGHTPCLNCVNILDLQITDTGFDALWRNLSDLNLQQTQPHVSEDTLKQKWRHLSTPTCSLLSPVFVNANAEESERRDDVSQM